MSIKYTQPVLFESNVEQDYLLVSLQKRVWKICSVAKDFVQNETSGIDFSKMSEL